MTASTSEQQAALTGLASPLNLNARRQIVWAEVITVAVLHATLTPFLLVSMTFSQQLLVHYLAITTLVLYPLSLLTARYWVLPRECRPIESLALLLALRQPLPDEIVREARVRVMNLPVMHAAIFFIRYEAAALISCWYMHRAGGLPSEDTISFAIHATVGTAFFPVLSFLLTERFLFAVRTSITAGTPHVPLDSSRIIRIGLRTRLVLILLATVSAPLIALGVIMYRRIGMELSFMLFEFTPDNPVMVHLFDLIFSVTGVAVLLTSAIGILLAMSISDPLGHIAGIIGQVESGNLKSRTNLLANDETGDLSQQFDRMAGEIEKGRSALEELNRVLEQRVAEKTADLTRALEQITASNRDLAVANRKLKELDRLKSDFVSVVSHEMRTPLTSIKAFAELIIMKPEMPAEKRKRLLSIINNENDRLIRLINDILDLNKIEAGKYSWNIRRVDLAEVIQSTVANIRALADNKGVSIQSPPAGLPVLDGDHDRLMQVVTNLLSNAIKFTPSGGAITIKAACARSPVDQVTISITDTGIGIPLQDLEIIFEKFHRSSGDLTNSAEGTGLGLSISKYIVEHHGGRIWAESTPGKGSTFFFTLPLDKDWKTGDGRLTSAPVT
jgi:signal transduction histidine kinase